MKQQQQVQPQNERKSITQPPLSEEERVIYGNRQPKGYKKLSILGRGGCALVWLAIDETSQIQVALKQFPKFSNGQPNANLDSGYRELQINKGYFNAGGQISDKFSSHPGIQVLCRFLDSYEDKQDLWLVFELCGKPLSKQLYEVKGEFFKGERIYSVVHDDALFFRFEESNCKLFKILIERLAQALQLLQVSGNVHSDLKSENIMLINKNDGEIDFKIIDLGSGFPFAKINDYLETTTPEYLPPEILEFIEQKQSLSSQGQQLDITKRIHPWSLDVWSMGAILLETVIGFPLWLSYKGRILKSTISSTVQQGLFAVQGRVPKKIILKQQAFLKSLRPTLRKSFPRELCLGGLNQNEQFIDLLSGMMDLNPLNRLSPKEILSHPFLKYD
ncbi:hypothetical protein FGO68_gene9878 [Halteria grandinella]|uniref:Protein kinase domain-containing protein n=1 Tax=Halteria grandinella TaxID=5974 RepID=A0A8J8NEZ0_HALGN|nr:hypothetical protein FGO68_gene9878 [Halteria grandinella]